ncbi:hypothetical protein DPSP01_011743 [Paraphaeosphaeria sporulosa]
MGELSVEWGLYYAVLRFDGRAWEIVRSDRVLCRPITPLPTRGVSVSVFSRHTRERHLAVFYIATARERWAARTPLSSTLCWKNDISKGVRHDWLGLKRMQGRIQDGDGEMVSKPSPGEGR